MYGSSTEKLSSQICIRERRFNPVDSVQCIEFLPGDNSSVFAVGGWDGRVHCYMFSDHGRGELTLKFSVPIGEPILSLLWANDSVILAGCVNGDICCIDIANQRKEVPFRIEAPVIGLHGRSIGGTKALFVVGMENKVSIFDMDTGKGLTRVKIPYAACCVDFGENIAVFGLVENRVYVVSIEDLAKDLFGKEFDSPLASPLSCVSVRNNDKEFLLGSVDGRVSRCVIKGYGTPEISSELLYKAHKSDSSAGYSSNKILHSVNTIDYSNASGVYGNSFLTGGSDNKFYIWDYIKKTNSLVLKGENDESVTCAKFNDNGTILAIATGYDWIEGIYGMRKMAEGPRIYVRVIKHNDLQGDAGYK